MQIINEQLVPYQLVVVLGYKQSPEGPQILYYEKNKPDDQCTSPFTGRCVCAQY